MGFQNWWARVGWVGRVASLALIVFVFEIGFAQSASEIKSTSSPAAPESIGLSSKGTAAAHSPASPEMKVSNSKIESSHSPTAPEANASNLKAEPSRSKSRKKSNSKAEKKAIAPDVVPPVAPATSDVSGAAAALGAGVEKGESLYLLSELEPFVPRDVDYSVELGAMAERKSLFWVAGNMGWHLGRCALTSSQTCQQYFDAIIGVAGRDGETYGNFWGSIRWQFVNFPRSWSPLVRVFGGAVQAHLPYGKEWRAVSGVGIGMTTFLHDKVDLRFEARAGYADHMFSQAMIGVQIKTDRLLEYFAQKAGELGMFTVRTAVQATGEAVKATGVGITTVIEGAASALGSDEPKSDSGRPTPSATPAPH